MSALPVTRLEVRCPKCNAMQFVIVVPGSGVIEVCCRRHRCDAVLIVDGYGNVQVSAKPCIHKLNVLTSD